jgi:hypothetical protein
VADQNYPGVKAFFRKNFTGWDWGILLALVTAFSAVIWLLVDLTISAAGAEIRADVAEVRADLTVLTDEVTDTKSDLTKQFSEIVANVTSVLEEHATIMESAIENGMTERTNELALALASKFETARTLTVYVTNVPRNDPEVLAIVSPFVNEHGSLTTVSNFADSMIVSTRLKDLNGIAAQDLQAVVEELWLEHPEIETVLSWDESSGPGYFGGSSGN